LGYCNTKVPDIRTRLGRGGKVRKIAKFSTWTYTNWNWIYDSFYPQGLKIIPRDINLEQYLSPLALAIWIMDDGARISQGIKLCTNSFSYQDHLYLIDILFTKYHLKASINSAGNGQYYLYIWKESKPLLWKIVQPYIIPEMKYKFLS
jgi:ubiquinol-cytochrome c reductase cytochrome b subunit